MVGTSVTQELRLQKLPGPDKTQSCRRWEGAAETEQATSHWTKVASNHPLEIRYQGPAWDAVMSQNHRLKKLGYL